MTLPAHSRYGFTLIELLIVISIIGILSSLLMSNFIGAQQRGRDAQRKSDLKQIQIALEQYKADNGHYPCTSGADSTYSWQISGSTSWIVDHCTADTPLFPTYITKMPKDPLNSTVFGYPWDGSNTESYAYYSVGTNYNTCPQGTFYMLLARLENKNDPQRLGLNNYTYCGVDMLTLFGGPSSPGAYDILYTAP